MSQTAKDIAKSIADLISSFEEYSPRLSGDVEYIDSTGEEKPIEWSLHLDGEDEVKIVIETGVNAIYLNSDRLTLMMEALDFFTSLEPKQRKVIMNILEKE